MADILFEERVLGFFLAILLLYSAYLLLKILDNKETSLAMVFIHKNRIKSLFVLMVLASFFTLITGILYALNYSVLLVEIALNTSVFIFFVFTYLLQKLMKGDESQ